MDSPPTSLWQHRPFLRLWIAQAVSNAGTTITRMALPLTAVLLLEATPTQMGLLRMADSLPNLLFGLVAGVWVDRVRRRPLLVGADLGRVLLLGSIPVAAWFGYISFAQLWIVAFLAGTLTVFFQIASIAMLPALVSKAQIVEANSKFSLSDAVIAIGGPGTAGALVQWLSAPVAILIDAISYLLSALALDGIGAAEPPPERRESRLWVEIMDGVRELVRTPLLKMLTITSSLGMLAGGLAGAVQVLYLVHELNFTPAIIGFVSAFGGVGALLGSLSNSRGTQWLGVGPIMLLGKVLAICGGLLTVAAGLWDNALPLVSVGNLLAGMGGIFYFVNQISLRQVITSHELMGRVTAARRFILFGVAAVGAAFGGLLGESIGLRATLLVSVLALVGELVLIYFSPLRQARV
jgi:Major Facilitator Superfamily